MKVILFSLLLIFSVALRAQMSVKFNSVRILAIDVNAGIFIASEDPKNMKNTSYFFDLEKGLSLKLDHACLQINFKQKDEECLSSFGEFSYYEVDYQKNLFSFYYKSSDKYVRLDYKREKGYLRYVGNNCKPKHTVMSIAGLKGLSGKVAPGEYLSETYNGGKLIRDNQNAVPIFSLRKKDFGLYDLGYLVIIGELLDGNQFKGDVKIKYMTREHVPNHELVTKTIANWNNGEIIGKTNVSKNYYEFIGESKFSDLVLSHGIDQETLLPKGDGVLSNSNADSVLAKGKINQDFKFTGSTSLSLPNGEKVSISLKSNLLNYSDKIENSTLIETRFNWENTIVSKHFEPSFYWYLLCKVEKNPNFGSTTKHRSSKFKFRLKYYLYNASNKDISYLGKGEIPFLLKVGDKFLCEGLVENIEIPKGETFLVGTDYTNYDDMNKLSKFIFEGIYLEDGNWNEMNSN